MMFKKYNIDKDGCIFDEENDIVICKFKDRKIVIDKEAIRIMDADEKYGINIRFEEPDKNLLIEFRDFALYGKIPEKLGKNIKAVNK